MCMFCRSLFVPLYFFLWSLCCLSFVDMRILILPLVSSNSFFYPVHVEVYSIQHYVIKFVSDWWQVGEFLRVLRFSPPIVKLIAITEILLKVALNTITIRYLISWRTVPRQIRIIHWYKNTKALGWLNLSLGDKVDNYIIFVSFNSSMMGVTSWAETAHSGHWSRTAHSGHWSKNCPLRSLD